VWASNNLSHPNVVPIIGVYSSPAYPFALVYEMMENVDLRQHLAQQPAISRLKFVSTVFMYNTGGESSIEPFPPARRNIPCIETPPRPRYHSREYQVGVSSHLIHHHHILTLLQRNLLVDSNHVARLGGFGSAFSLSLPASWSDVESERLFGGIAPELIDPRAFGFVEARNTKATDMFSFGMLAWEVSIVSFRLPVSRNLSALVPVSGPRW
jgi:hypothetical protein